MSTKPMRVAMSHVDPSLRHEHNATLIADDYVVSDAVIDAMRAQWVKNHNLQDALTAALAAIKAEAMQ